MFVLAAVSEREQLPAQVTVPAPAAATKKITISETRPGFEKRILEERPSQTRVSDNWFVLLEGDLKASGIFFLVWSFFVLCVAKKNLTQSCLVCFIKTLISNSCYLCTGHTGSQLAFSIIHGPSIEEIMLS